MSTVTALTSAVDAENAAIFVYGIATAFTAGESRTAVAEYIAAHRVRRTEINEALTSAGGQTRELEPGYTLPAEVTDQRSAHTLLLTAETDCAIAYRALLEQADSPALRRTAIAALTDCALRAATWRRALGQTPSTVALPGTP